jgi:hypothetical protein
MKDHLITMRQIAALFNINYTALCATYKALPGFPTYIGHIDRQRGYSHTKIKAWAKGKDVSKLVYAEFNRAYQTKSGAQRASKRPPSLCNETAAAFLRGDFSTAEQTERHSYKKMIARTVGAKTLRVSVNPDWMQE